MYAGISKPLQKKTPADHPLVAGISGKDQKTMSLRWRFLYYEINRVI
jgi:hypothetical protein